MTTAVRDQNYVQAVKSVCKDFVNFGRGVGPIDLELQEVDASDIKRLGSWAADTQEAVHSCKLLLKQCAALPA
jgi:hypothetical protein